MSAEEFPAMENSGNGSLRKWVWQKSKKLSNFCYYDTLFLPSVGIAIAVSFIAGNPFDLC